MPFPAFSTFLSEYEQVSAAAAPSLSEIAESNHRLRKKLQCRIPALSPTAKHHGRKEVVRQRKLGGVVSSFQGRVVAWQDNGHGVRHCGRQPPWA
jgi:hypothetical protein